jgi:hypothetical protein
MRSKPTSVNNPRTPAQLAHRAKFSAVIQFLKPLTSFLRIGFKSQAIEMSGFNAAMSYNLKNAVEGTYPDYTVDFTAVKLTSGNLPGALNAGVTSTVSGEVAFTWDDNSSEDEALADDKAMLVVYNPAKGLCVPVIGGNTRASGTQVVTVPNLFAGDQVQCYLSFSNATGSICSDSQYVGAVDVV